MNYAGFWRRFAALLIDGLILFIPMMIVSVVIPYLGGILLSLLYVSFFESSAAMATPGKKYMGLMVTSESGQRIDFKTALIRFLARTFLSWILLIGYLFYFFTEKKQTLHDVLASTLVLRRPTDDEVDFIQVWKDQFFAVVPFSSGSNSGQPGKDHLAQLDQLHQLFQRGAITEDEYQTKKQEILKHI